jgi:exopolyphosphatase / guanosine-5'-triphosphate,3'-diphosphate pyrophosphatase
MRDRIFHKRLGWGVIPAYLALIIVFVVLLSGCALHANKICTARRAAFDMGSTTLKMKTAEVDTCRHKTIGIFHQWEVKVPFAENFRDRLLSRDVQERGIEQLQSMKKEAQSHNAQRFAGAATAVFRQAANTSRYLQEIKNKTGINIRMISQDEEAILGYEAALAQTHEVSENIVVWDIGGNSMQMIMKGSGGKFTIYRGQMASIPFKNQILTKIHHQMAGIQVSPNPICRGNLAEALKIAMNAASDLPDEIKNQIHRMGTVVIGIGGVHNQSIRKQVKKVASYSRENIMNVLQDRLDLTDEQIGGQYADTEVSNLILVLGFMQKLEIEEVLLADVNLADGILVDPAFWR